MEKREKKRPESFLTVYGMSWQMAAPPLCAHFPILISVSKVLSLLFLDCYKFLGHKYFLDYRFCTLRYACGFFFRQQTIHKAGQMLLALVGLFTYSFIYLFIAVLRNT